MAVSDISGPPALSLVRLFLRFLKFGCLAFGGPVAQIAMVREELVERERWIDKVRFNRLLAVMQALPGPEAHELCVHMGMIARGRIGGLLAGLGFMLPGFILMLACAAAYDALLAGNEGLAGAFLGAQIVVLAVIARSVQRIGQHILVGWVLGAIAVTAGVAVLAGVQFWLLLIIGGLANSSTSRPLSIALLTPPAIWAIWNVFNPVHDAGMSMAVATSAVGHATPLALFIAGLKGGLLTFGGAYTAIPYVRADTVGRGWLGDGTFLDGVAVANLLPAPLVIFATFAGYSAGGLAGALAITTGMFLPAFTFSMVFFERLEALVDHIPLQRALDGVAAAAVGIIAATLIELATATYGRLDSHFIALAIFVPAVVAAWKLKGGWVAPTIIGAGVAVGAALLD